MPFNCRQLPASPTCHQVVAECFESFRAERRGQQRCRVIRRRCVTKATVCCQGDRCQGDRCQGNETLASSPSFDKREQEVEALYDVLTCPQLDGVDWQFLGFVVGLRGMCRNDFQTSEACRACWVSLACPPTLNAGSTSCSGSVEGGEAI